MALFEKVQRLSPECHKQLIQFYESPEHRFPIEVRNLFPKEIEDVVCGSRDDGGGLDPCNPTHGLQITEFLSNLIGGLENRITNSSNEVLPFFMQHKLTEAVKDFKSRTATNALGLFQTIRECIFFELTLVKSASSADINDPPINTEDGIMEDVSSIRKRMLTTADLLNRIMNEQEAFEINCNEKQTMDDYLVRVRSVITPNGQTQDFEKSVLEKITTVDLKQQENVKNLMLFTQSFEESVGSNLKELSKLQGLVQKKIQLWKYEQQLQANGLVHQNPILLTKLQAWCEELADLIWTTRQQLKDAERLQSHNPILNTSASSKGLTASSVPLLTAEVTRLLSELLSGSFLVEVQPPQVMKLGTRFPSPMTLSLLVGNRLNVQMTSPTVTTCIISEAQARGLNGLENTKIGVSGDIVNGNSKLEFNRDARRLIANFRSMQLKRIKRADKKGGVASESVMEEKFCLLFESVVTVGDLNIRIWTLSMPVVVISHGSQEAQAVATITWDNAFGEMGRVPFQVPQRLPWTELANVLSLKFQTVTGRGLTEDHLRCLQKKAFRNGSHSEFITWNEFCKDNLPDRNFSFWDWFYAAMKIIERKDTHLKDLWKDGLIMGFIERHAAEELLSHRQPGTFLLRFSDSLTGAITIAWLHDDSNVYLVNPFQLHDLTKDKLADSIAGLEHMKFLYPDVPKDRVFGKYYSPPTPQGPIVNPYVKPKMHLDIPGSSIRLGTPSSTPSRSRSNSWAPLPSVVPTSSGGPQYPWTSPAQISSYNPENPFQAAYNSIMETGMVMEEASPDGRNGHSPIPEETENTLPNFSALGGPFSKFGTNRQTDNGSVNSVMDEAMQIPLEEQFSDLLTVIRSDMTNSTNM